MKRTKAACIKQTPHFMPKEDVDHDLAVEPVKDEVDKCKMQLECNRIQYKFLPESVGPDGS